MNEEKLNELMNMISDDIPKGNVSGKKLIQSHEAITSKINKTEVDLYDLAAFAYGAKHPQFEMVNEYFKHVHSIIRDKAEKKSSLLYQALEELLLINFKAGSKITFTKQNGLKALLEALDWYDPNKNQSYQDKRFHWDGFESLILTKEGIPVEVRIGNDIDKEMFYDALDGEHSKPTPIKTIVKETPLPSPSKTAKVFVNKKRS